MIEIRRCEAAREAVNARILTFNDISEREKVFNVTTPFRLRGNDLTETTYILGRIAPKNDDLRSRIGIFKQTDEADDSTFTLYSTLSPKDAGGIGLEDPAITKVDNTLVVSCVQTYPTDTGIVGWKTIFFKGPDIDHLEKFAKGPDGMKDVRLVQLQNGKIGMFTRPMKIVHTEAQRTIDVRGRIGFTVLDSLDDLNESTLANAPLIDLPFKPNEWGGVNHTYLFKNGIIGVVGHIAHEDLGGKHYKTMAFTFNPYTRSASSMEIIAKREDFSIEQLAMVANTHKKDITFPGGLTEIKDKPDVFNLWCNLDDELAVRMPVPIPRSFTDQNQLAA